ncbi:T9SS type A sorting domain-containing protein [Dyadobacter sp. 32]|uniref:T9SS type A sorting domain-containing protein n=1 Tax=Dyadobacter sp. 32 TaxID=538966 RepID=UPI0011ED8013
MLINAIFLLATPYCRSQEISINISGASAIAPGQSSYLLVNICNEDPNPVTMPAYKFASRIMVTPGVVITGVTNTDGSVLTGWETAHNLSSDSGEVELLNSIPLPNAECIAFNIIIKATQTVDSATIKAELVFPEKLVSPNRPDNDSSISKIGIQTTQTARLMIATPNIANTSEDNMLFPNPFTADKKLNVNTSGLEKIKSIKIFDIAGKLLQKPQKLNQINTERLEPGTYLVTITYTDGTTTTQRVVKQ